MNSRPRTAQWLVWGFLLVILSSIIGTFVWKRLNDPAEDLGKPLLVYGELPEFALTNQHERVISLAQLRGQVWVGDIIFTRCAGPCPRMTRRMSELQGALSGENSVRLVTMTTDPEFDTPPVMREYARRFGADSNRWHFLTGDKRQIARLAVDGLKLTALEKEPSARENEADLFIHSTLFVVVDKRGRLRGAFESLEPEAHRQIVAAVKRLVKEP